VITVDIRRPDIAGQAGNQPPAHRHHPCAGGGQRHQPRHDGDAAHGQQPHQQQDIFFAHGGTQHAGHGGQPRLAAQQRQHKGGAGADRGRIGQQVRRVPERRHRQDHQQAGGHAPLRPMPARSAASAIMAAAALMHSQLSKAKLWRYRRDGGGQRRRQQRWERRAQFAGRNLATQITGGIEIGQRIFHRAAPAPHHDQQAPARHNR
jgi:hypothetical protein